MFRYVFRYMELTGARIIALKTGQKTPISLSSCIDKRLQSTKTQPANRVVQSMSQPPIYKIVFFNQGQIYEIYARQIYQSDLYGFIEVEELVFGERSGVLVDPSEEKLKAEFEGVSRSYLPMHSIVRIDEVAKEGVGTISEAKGMGNVSPFPVPAFTPKGSSD